MRNILEKNVKNSGVIKKIDDLGEQSFPPSSHLQDS